MLCAILNRELDTENYDFIRMDQLRRGGGVACYIRNSFSYSDEPNICRGLKNILVNVFLPKSKPFSVGVLYWPSSKPEFIEYLDNFLKEINNCNIQDCSRIGDFNVNLSSGNKMLLKKHPGSYGHAKPLVKKYMGLYFSHSLH